jgi:phage terminase large subunit-like protein
LEKPLQVNSHAKKCNEYAENVVNGRVIACQNVVLACQRHLDDLNNESSPYRFDEGKANSICEFAELMPHVKGKWSGSILILEPWQCFFLGVPFGWVRKSDGTRRFREIYGEIPRKNGKSVLGAIIGLYMFSADNEPGAEVYSAATSEAQAYEVFRPAWQMTSKLPSYQKRFSIDLGGTERNPGNIFSLETFSRFETVIGKPGDGASPHCWLQDEYHEAKSDVAYDAGKTGMGARLQPMMVVITTAGTNTSYPCYSKRKQVEKVLRGELSNEELFGIIYSIDKDDDWADFKTWEKANPNLGISVFEDFLRGQLKTGLQEARKQNILKCKHLNVWSNAGESWLNSVDWEKCADKSLDINEFRGQPVWIGIDLASKIDIASRMRLFKMDDHYYLFSSHYIPGDRTEGEDATHYLGWVEEGYLDATPGARIDFAYIKEDIFDDAKNFDLRGQDSGGGEVCNDPWNAQQLITELDQEGIATVEINQTVNMLSEPMKEIEACVRDGKFHHDDNPVTNWMFKNVCCRYDKKDNVFPFKEAKENKIDGAVASITAMSRAMRVDVSLSIYDPRNPDYRGVVAF